MSPLLLLLISFIIKACAIDLHSPWTMSAGSTYGSYKFNVLHHLTGISPYFESNSEGLNPDPPQDCTIDRVAYLLRHGALYVNEYDYVSIIEPFLQRLKNASNYVKFSESTDLSFLTHWTSPVSNSREQIAKLSKLGYLEAFSLGTRLAYRYPNLMPTAKDTSFKVWGSNANRTKHSAEALFAGLFAGHETIGKMVNVSENSDRGADTLTPTRSCPNFDVSKGTRQADVWLKNYAVPIIARLNAKVPGFHFSAHDVMAMQELCGYETIIRGSSLFCGIFTSEEWLSFEYYFDIKYYYELGYGNDLSPTLGMPWLVATSDLLAHAKANNQRLYISVAHRQIPPLILTALGLFNDSEYLGTSNVNPVLPLDKINYQRAWKTSSFISFLSQIALERLNCKSTAYNGSYVRILVNSVPKPLPGCVSGPSDSCPLKQFTDYVKQRHKQYEDFTKACGVKNKNVPDAMTFFVKEQTV
ncbi:unnamed protein product [Rotaria magnacalcarata]|uniref:Uncharacterized protein n=2 Tax=Rotaria magnacalcarata TaxID=392030 RepID=A0A816QH49_9BILA|nr:unnamed protein product [Rotaria magnacalcarata]